MRRRVASRARQRDAYATQLSWKAIRGATLAFDETSAPAPGK